MASSDSAQPNIVFILSDDQGRWALGCVGNSEIRTPHLDQLAAAGVRFETVFCTPRESSPDGATT